MNIKKQPTEYLRQKANVIHNWRRELASMRDFRIAKNRKIDEAFNGIISRLEGMAESFENESAP